MTPNAISPIDPNAEFPDDTEIARCPECSGQGCPACEGTGVVYRPVRDEPEWNDHDEAMFDRLDDAS
jgi:hypothetical protein